jgi:uncharacterized protein involved in exopolysaccharide biosynthesis/Mrp family chromosome partitioning ATPase
MGLGDVLYILFRHKWKIILLSIMGIGGAVAVYIISPLPWTSEAKLVVRYVMDSKPPVQVAMPGQPGANNAGTFTSPDARGETIINSQMEILGSQDLALLVADAVGPEKILGKPGATNRYQAAAYIESHLKIEAPKKSSVISISFQHKNPEIVQSVLNQVVDTYIKRQAEIYRAGGVFDEFLTQQTDQLRSRLARTEGELRQARTNAGVVSLLDDTKKGYDAEISKIRQAILETEGELAQRQTEAAELSKLLPATAQSITNSQNKPNVTPPAEKVTEYKRLCSMLEMQSKREQEWRLQFTEGSSMVKSAQAVLAATETLKKQMEDDYPGLLMMGMPEQRSVGLDPTIAQRSQLMTVTAQAAALQAKLKSLTNQLEQVRKELNNMVSYEGVITELGRTKDLEEAQYKYFAANLEQTRINEQLSNSKSSNIAIIQAASLPFKDGKKLMKMVAAIFFVCFGGGIGLAFGIEMFLDLSVKRPIEVESRLRLPLFLSIPRMKINGVVHRKALQAARTPLLADKKEPSERGGESVVQPPAPHPSPLVPPWDYRHSLRPFLDALRDRMITFFEQNNLTHKPKMLALTSCGQGAGVTTIAAGLAASLSETGDGKVLLVDMHEHGGPHQFYRGNLTCGLEDALELEKRDTAMVQEKLYVVKENDNSEKLPRSLPKHFQHLVPRLKASDYDYIIFDMPPISQISVTPKLARFMDVTMIVVEANQTDAEVVKRASAYLTQTGATVGVVLNKLRNYGPRRLQQEI